MLSLRSTPRLLGPFSRMMDMGGVPSAKTGPQRVKDASKNCHVQALCFDFGVLTSGVSEKDVVSTSRSESDVKLDVVQADASRVQEVANLLNVQLGSETPRGGKHRVDDLSLLTGSSDTDNKANDKPEFKNPFDDIRTKYADKLSKKGASARPSSPTADQGDAADLMAARKIALQTSGSRWMAQTWTGLLLGYLTKRSMKIVLLPTPGKDESQGQLMEDFRKQLSDVVFDLLLKDGNQPPDVTLRLALKDLELQPEHILVVSNRDDYLKAAKEAGTVTCRIRPLSAPRGNVSAHYTVPTVPEVQDVVNEINGISFNALLQR